MLNVNWIRYDTGLWCNLIDLDLDQRHFDNLEGVYIIWNGNTYDNVVRVGQGIIKDRLSAHRIDREILAYSQNGLLVTWAVVDTRYRDGVERYLAETFNPEVGNRFPLVPSIMVNHPG